MTDLSHIEKETKGTYGEDSEIASHASLKRLESALWRELEAASPKQREIILKSSQVEKISTLNKNHDVGWFRPSQIQYAQTTAEPRRVLIEWMLYSPIWGKQTDEEKVIKIAALAELLHSPKPKRFHVLDCIELFLLLLTQLTKDLALFFRFQTATINA